MYALTISIVLMGGVFGGFFSRGGCANGQCNASAVLQEPDLSPVVIIVNNSIVDATKTYSVLSNPIILIPQSKNVSNEGFNERPRIFRGWFRR